MNFKYEDFALPLEQTISEQIYQAIEGDIIEKIIKIGKIHTGNNYDRSLLEGHSFKVEAETLSHYYELFNEVKDKLEFKEAVDFYITGDSSVNAYAIPADDDECPNIINVNSSLIELMTDDELRFVIGHELGHLISKNAKLMRLVHFVFPDKRNPPIALQYKYRLWKQLAELVADRFGFIAMPDINVCISAFFKMASGLDFNKMQMKVDAFIEENNRRLDYFRNDKGMNVATHPINPIRVQALNILSQSEFFVKNGISKETMQEKMNELTDILLKIKNTPLDMYMAQFIATAGLIVATTDQPMNEDELEVILNELSNIKVFSQDYLKDISQKDVAKLFEESIVKILETNPEMREAMLRYLMHIAMADNAIEKQETNVIFDIGNKILGYSVIEIAQIFAQMIQFEFNPGIQSIY